MMRYSLYSLSLLLALSAPVVAQETDAAGVIQDQIEAFQANDVATAFGFASPTIQAIFGNAETFGQMVQQGYPMVWRPAAVKYLDQRTAPGGVYQKVAITDQAGVLHVLEYQMLAVEGGWVINGVQVLQQPEVGA